MKKYNMIIKEVIKGNGNNFTIKEMLQAQINNNKKFEDYVRDKFEKGTGKIATNSTRIDAIVGILKYLGAPTITAIIVAVVISYL